MVAGADQVVFRHQTHLTTHNHARVHGRIRVYVYTQTLKSKAAFQKLDSPVVSEVYAILRIAHTGGDNLWFSLKYGDNCRGLEMDYGVNTAELTLVITLAVELIMDFCGCRLTTLAR